MSDPGTDEETPLEAHHRNISGGRLAPAAALLSASSLGLRLFALLTTSILARALVPSDYGVVALAATVTGFLDVISNIQVAGSIIRSRDISEEQLKSAFTINFLRGLMSGAIMYLFSRPLSAVLGDPRLDAVLSALAIVPLLNGLQNPAFILYERKLQFLPDVTRMFLANLLGAAVSIAVALSYHTYWALVASQIVIASVHCLMTYWRIPSNAGLSLKHAREMFGFGGWLALVSIVDYINNRVDILLIGRGLGTALLGGYQAGQQIMTTATGDVVGPLVKAIFPALAMTKSIDELRAKYVKVQAVIISLALPIGFGLSVLAPLAVAFLLGNKWQMAVPVVQWLAPLIALQTMLATVDAVAMTTGQTKRLFQRTLAVFAVRVSLLLVGYRLGGFMGIVYARVFSGSFYLAYGLFLAARLTHTSVWAPIANTWRSLCAGALMYAGLTILEMESPSALQDTRQVFVRLVSRIAIGATIYIATHVALWWFSNRPAGVEEMILSRFTTLVAMRRARNAP